MQLSRVWKHVGLTAVLLLLIGCRNLYDKQVETPTHKELIQPFTAVAASEMDFETEAARTHSSSVRSLFCQPNDQNQYPHDAVINGGDGEDSEAGDYVYGEGGGCVERPLREVWATSLNQSLMVWNDDKNNNSATWDDISPPAGVAKYFAVHYSHREDMKLKSFTIHWDMNWIHQVRLGSHDFPTRVMINYHKYQGEKHMYYWQGTIILDRIASHLTGVYIRNQLRLARSDAEDAKSGARDILEKLRIGVPAYDNLPK